MESPPVVLTVVPAAPDYTTRVQPIFNANCTRCHGFNGGLRLEAGFSYNQLVNVASGERPGVNRVTPGDPDNSYLYIKVAGNCIAPNCLGDRMPQGGALGAADIQTIRDWIAGGAPP